MGSDQTVKGHLVEQVESDSVAIQIESNIMEIIHWRVVTLLDKLGGSIMQVINSWALTRLLKDRRQTPV